MTSEARSLLSRDTHVDEATLRRVLVDELKRGEILAAAMRDLADQFVDLHRATYRGEFMVTKNRAYVVARKLLETL